MGKIKFVFLTFTILLSLTFCHFKNRKDVKDYKYQITGWVSDKGVKKKAIWYTDTICFIQDSKNFFRGDTLCVITDTGYYYNSDGSLHTIVPPYTINNNKKTKK